MGAPGRVQVCAPGGAQVRAPGGVQVRAPGGAQVRAAGEAPRKVILHDHVLALKHQAPRRWIALIILALLASR